MISFEEAYEKVMENTFSFGVEKTLLTHSRGRVLAEDVLADRDSPPFNRSTKDGITINYKAIEDGQKAFKIEGVIAAGTAKTQLKDSANCLEIMTGAVLPDNADTVVMYEDIEINDGVATLKKEVVKGQNIHRQGSDVKQGEVIIKKNTKITAAEIGILASVGKVEVSVKELPKITLISTGNELVAVHEKPLPHQIRGSNTLSLHALLETENIHAEHLHLDDEKESIKNNLRELFGENDVLMLSGGVSRGKFDYIPEVLDELGVEKVFHKVKQRPGKPFWFGLHKASKTIIFSFPGNPVSTFANYHVYFKDWLYKAMEIPAESKSAILMNEVENDSPLTLFVRVKLKTEAEKLHAFLISENGSGDLSSLAHTDGFIRLSPDKKKYEKGTVVPCILSRYN
ncbi:molybdopterin molybdotransferase MoeA [Galbibacter sp. EGI 63066]|uniref:molybdopterin molybdotransferase MoeA n=1 Tax=Galbibacter sp. EGI 63066 TaxID=2993559 RepID=UPI0022498086|nr:molybdopterin molybdotransferase MoeA [Galbibacter sp. EGI 63066]MCX2679941.1 molybdopterin molybdotransferase MoeA [Galbibacter sp. EGI 63066]